MKTLSLSRNSTIISISATVVVNNARYSTVVVVEEGIVRTCSHPTNPLKGFTVGTYVHNRYFYRGYYSFLFSHLSATATACLTLSPLLQRLNA